MTSNNVVKVGWQIVNELGEGVTVCVNAERGDWFSIVQTHTSPVSSSVTHLMPTVLKKIK